MSEIEIQREILKYLESIGILAWRNNTQGVMRGKGVRTKNENKGAPDIFGVLPNGKLLAIEVKVAGKKPSLEQAEWLKRLRAFNACAFWADSLEDVIKRLHQYS